VISTPVSILAALGNATRHGILVKGGTYLEQAGTLRVIAFDKTGTLTEGRPAVSDVVALNGSRTEDVLALAAAVERDSEHPLARAILAAGDGTADGRPDVQRFRAVAGLGVRAEVDGRLVFVGRPQLLGAHASDPALGAALARLESEGKTAVAVGDERGALGVIAVSDPLRPAAPAALAGLRAAGVEHLAMLTGDNAATAAAVGAAAGVDDVRAGLLPADKVAAIHELQDRHGAVGMVGDGVNDAPALAAATLGIAMGAAGTDAAIDTADIALMGDDLEALPRLVRLSRRTGRIIRQNITASIAIKAVFLVLAPLGLTSLWLAVFADMGTSLLVTGNGLRLHRD
jgi:Cd2+/Zn2+-exporting ATPase